MKIAVLPLLTAKRLPALLFSAAVVCLPASANILFSDLGPDSDAYNAYSGELVQGGYPSQIIANMFTVAGSGSQVVSEIEMAVTNQVGFSGTFYAAIFSDASGSPGAQLPGAYWSLTGEPFPLPCCSPGPLVTVSDISGITLTGGAQYFLVLGPLNVHDDSKNVFDFNNQGVTGDVQSSDSGAANWGNVGTATLGAFAILGGASAPEPSTAGLLAVGLALFGFGSLRAIGRTKPSGSREKMS